MKAEAPQAPVSPSTKNRKASGTPHSAALERGPNKGSALFRELMKARTALMNGAGLGAEKSSVMGEKLLAALLKVPRHGPLDLKLPGIPTGDPGLVEAGGQKDKLETARKGARVKTIFTATHTGQVHSQPGLQQKSVDAGKEQKLDSGEPGKAPIGDTKAVASRAEPLIRIIDLRRAEKTGASTEAAAARTAEQLSAFDKDAGVRVALRPGSARDPALEALPKPVSVSSAHSQTPLERLREMAGSELVRASSLVLKDGGGEIRLVLKPESLGSVRIRMNIVDNAIEGRIIVDSSAVKHVFDGSVDALRRALTAEGFQMGSLQVSVGGQNAETGGRRQQDDSPAAVKRVAAGSFERNVPGAEDVSLGDLFVNLFV